MAQTLNIGESLTLEALARTSMGQRAKFSTAPSWSSLPPGVLELTPAADGASCQVRAVAAGDCVLTIAAPTLTAATFAISVLPDAAAEIVVRVVKV